MIYEDKLIEFMTLDLSLDGEKLPIYLSLDEIILPYLASITGYDSSSAPETVSSPQDTMSAPVTSMPQANMGPSVMLV
ncbi:MAG: hypothetical protein ACNI3H_12670 [Halarcobacter ebronensis]